MKATSRPCLVKMKPPPARLVSIWSMLGKPPYHTMQINIRGAWTLLCLCFLGCFVQMHVNSHIPPLFPREEDDLVGYVSLHGADKRPDRGDGPLEGAERFGGRKKESVIEEIANGHDIRSFYTPSK